MQHADIKMLIISYEDLQCILIKSSYSNNSLMTELPSCAFCDYWPNVINRINSQTITIIDSVTYLSCLPLSRVSQWIFNGTISSRRHNYDFKTRSTFSLKLMEYILSHEWFFISMHPKISSQAIMWILTTCQQCRGCGTRGEPCTRCHGNGRTLPDQ